MITCVFVVKANAPLYHGREMLSKEVDFLLTGLLPEGLLSSKKYAFMRKAKKYKMLDDVLYMKGSDLILHRVPWKEEIYKILEETHEGSCGGHFAMKIMLHKILQEGYVWPSIQQDVNHWCKSCLSCQKMGKRILKPELQKTILAFDVFEKWGLDAIGPLPMAGKRNAYVLIAVDYLSRWAEAKAIKIITSKEMGKFVYEHICCKFGVPLELLFDRGPGFRGELFDFLCSKLNIQLRYSSPYYPQCNGLNERFNGELVQILTKMTQTHGRTWDSELPYLDGAEHKYRVNGYRLKKYLARLMTVVTEEMLLMEKENDKVIENVNEVSGDELQQLFTLETSACHK
ncbi:hypothetical protein L7F22_061723 [Adiantum nelumboides]|nr:hypothetical protein [Adiantum nelumboides]